MQTQMNLCKVCNINVFKYVCPRCNLAYCSVNCYKARSHSDCSEAFYKECVQEYVKVEQADYQSRKEMIEILQRIRENDENFGDPSSDDSDDCESLNERLKDVNLDDSETVWEKLTDEERQEFMRFVKEGDVTELLPTWEPWWNKTYAIPKVRFVDNEDPPHEEHHPRIMENIPILSDVTRTKPSEFIFYNLINVLGSYVTVARYFNGEHQNMPNEAATILISISRNLCQNEIYTSIDLSLESLRQEAINCEFLKTNEDLKDSLREDIVKVLKGPNEEKCLCYIQAALSDIFKLLLLYKKSKPAPQKKKKFSLTFSDNNDVRKYSKETVTKCMQKIKYYQSWSLEYYNPKNFLLE